MRAGKLRFRVAVEQNLGSTPDAAGHAADNWQNVALLWASIEPLSGREYWNNKQVGADMTHVVRMRWQPMMADWKSSLRINFDGRLLYFGEPPRKAMEGRDVMLEVLCKETV